MLFAPPEEIAMTVFATLPDHLRITGRKSDWAFGREHALTCFLEGPTFDRAGDLLVTDIPYGRIFRISPSGDWSVVAGRLAERAEDPSRRAHLHR